MLAFAGFGSVVFVARLVSVTGGERATGAGEELQRPSPDRGKSDFKARQRLDTVSETMNDPSYFCRLARSSSSRSESK